MKRFLSTTALAIVVATSAHAAGHSNGIGAMTQMESSDFFASDLIGMRIYNSEVELDAMAPVADGAELEWDDIGEINDLIVSPEGEVKAVILGVGGFLGLGERDVAISMDSIKIMTEEGDAGDRFLVVTTSKEMLEAAPAFERDMNDSAAMEQSSEATETAMSDSADRTMLTPPTVERDGYAELDRAKIDALTAEELQGSYVYGPDDETVGEIDSLVLNDGGMIEKVVINVGGFLGLGEKQVAVTFPELRVLRNVEGDDTRIYIDSTEEALEALPEYEG
ncbi:PRC-barrel domain-containing protein [Sulfitobacter sabulilitoris]|uniref:PRC-barrel domain containing protein n=1 Tax=Sulfitobacter sabulilitoris TaxID=2562655 RepID=A0A5S3PCL4_9RHOB|nr:PRC-barrel domain-containing protein [Sulfitobacter sabulilitoris]TMM51597.1 PRC-barrel domain containing protein [Sulfitobacter sabulilitoris]